MKFFCASNRCIVAIALLSVVTKIAMASNGMNTNDPSQDGGEDLLSRGQFVRDEPSAKGPRSGRRAPSKLGRRLQSKSSKSGRSKASKSRRNIDNGDYIQELGLIQLNCLGINARLNERADLLALLEQDIINQVGVVNTAATTASASASNTTSALEAPGGPFDILTSQINNLAELNTEAEQLRARIDEGILDLAEQRTNLDELNADAAASDFLILITSFLPDCEPLIV